MSGSTLGQYQILELLGTGGMARVYKAVQLSLKRVVALKVISPEAAALPGFRERFEREAQTAARLQHLNIVTVHDFGEIDGLPYLVMQYVGGGTLDSLLKRGRPPSVPQAVQYTIKMAHALQHAHNEGIIHRDVKLSNMLLDERDPSHLLLSDFGIAKVLSTPLNARPGQPEALTPLTISGNIIGTPEYMAPEQALGGEIDGRADLYALGVVLYTLLAGRLPFQSTTPLGMLYQHINTPPLALRQINPLVSHALAEIVACALAKRPEDRFRSAEAFAHALETVLPLQSQIDGSSTLLAQSGLPVLSPDAWEGPSTQPGSRASGNTAPPSSGAFPLSSPVNAPDRSSQPGVTPQGVFQGTSLAGAQAHGFYAAPTLLPGQPTVVLRPPTRRRRSSLPWLGAGLALLLVGALVLLSMQGSFLIGLLKAGGVPTASTQTNGSSLNGPIVDTFKVNTNGWPVGNIDGDPALRWTLGNGVYDLVIPAGNTYAQSYFPAPASLHPPANFTLEITVKQVQGSTVLGYGLIFRETVITEDQQLLVNTYAFTINSSGQYQFQVYARNQAGPGSFSTPPAGTLQTGLGQSNDLKVVVQGDTFKLYANGALLPGPTSGNSWTDDSYASGQVGLLVTGDGEEAEEYQVTSFALTPLAG